MKKNKNKKNNPSNNKNKFKIYFKYGLLSFVALSIVLFFYKEISKYKSSNSSKTNSSQTSTFNENVNDDLVRVYYFHTSSRCYSCVVMENYIKETLKTNFQKELDKKDLYFQAVNIQKPENQAFISVFKLTSISLIIAKTKDNKVLKWKNLNNEVFRLLGKKDIFMNHLTNEINSFLKGS